MDVRKLNLEPDTRVLVDLVGGDLILRGHESTELEVHGHADEVDVEQEAGVVIVSSSSDVEVVAPVGAPVEVRKVGSDANLENLPRLEAIDRVGGDLRLTSTQAPRVKRVGGDLAAKDLQGDLDISHLGGDARIESVGGVVHARAVGGDLFVRGAAGVGNAAVGGDVYLEFTPAPDSDVTLNVGGDVNCRFAEDVSLTLTILAGGDIRIPKSLSRALQGGQLTVILGEGEANLQVRAGGDVWLRAGDLQEQTIEAQEVGDLIASKVTGKIEEMGAALDVMGVEIHGLDASRLGERIQRIVNRAVRRAGDAVDNARQHGAYNWIFGEVPGASSRGEPVSDEERLSILRLLEEGKITVGEAEKLLDALE